MNGPRRTSKTGTIALLLALLALALAGYAAWAASQARGGDPVVAAQLDSLRNEVRTLRARAAVGDSVGIQADSLGAAGPAVQAPAAAPPAGPVTTQPATPTKQP